jgi:hypothetical protein
LNLDRRRCEPPTVFTKPSTAYINYVSCIIMVGDGFSIGHPSSMNYHFLPFQGK